MIVTDDYHILAGVGLGANGAIFFAGPLRDPAKKIGGRYMPRTETVRGIYGDCESGSGGKIGGGYRPAQRSDERSIRRFDAGSGEKN